MLKGQTLAKRRRITVGVLTALALLAALAGPAAAQTTKTKVDLNTADLKTIAGLPGIGETLAQKIIDARPFKKLDDLSAIKGIGDAKIAGLKDLVSFSKVKPPKDTATKTETQTTTKETTVADKTKAATDTAAAKDEKVLVNVNKADLKTLQTLPGIGESLAQKIIDGRPYKTMDDLGKVKGIGDAKLKGLTGLVAFEDKVKEKTIKTATTKETTTAVDAKTKTVSTTTDKTKTTTETPAEKELINVNKADLKTLITLPGIGDALAQKIIDGRPYKTMDDLGKVKGIGDAKLKGIKDLISFEDKVKEKTVKTTTADKTKTTTTETVADKTKLAPGEKLDINTATAEQLDSLFGIGPVKSQAIVDYRTANGKFKAIEDIMKVKGIKEGEFAKIKDSIKVK